MIYPPVLKASKTGDILPDLADIVDKEHKRLLARKSIIEKRKEEQERQLLEMVPYSHQTVNNHIHFSVGVYMEKRCDELCLGTRGGIKKVKITEDNRRG